MLIRCSSCTWAPVTHRFSTLRPCVTKSFAHWLLAVKLGVHWAASATGALASRRFCCVTIVRASLTCHRRKLSFHYLQRLQLWCYNLGCEWQQTLRLQLWTSMWTRLDKRDHWNSSNSVAEFQAFIIQWFCSVDLLFQNTQKYTGYDSNTTLGHPLLLPAQLHVDDNHDWRPLELSQHDQSIAYRFLWNTEQNCNYREQSNSEVWGIFTTS